MSKFRFSHSFTGIGILNISLEDGLDRDQLQRFLYRDPNLPYRFTIFGAYQLLFAQAILHHLYRGIVRHDIFYTAGSLLGMGCHLEQRFADCPDLVTLQKYRELLEGVGEGMARKLSKTLLYPRHLSRAKAVGYRLSAE